MFFGKIKNKRKRERETDLKDSRWVRFNFKLKDENYPLLNATIQSSLREPRPLLRHLQMTESSKVHQGEHDARQGYGPRPPIENL